jgi:hypothetical protein
VFESRRDLVPVALIGLDGDCGTYRQRATDQRRTGRSVDDPRPVSALQRNLLSGQFDHRPRFGPFPGMGCRARPGCWTRTSRSSSSSSSSRGLSVLPLRTTHEKCGPGENADIVFRNHRIMLL